MAGGPLKPPFGLSGDVPLGKHALPKILVETSGGCKHGRASGILIPLQRRFVVRDNKESDDIDLSCQLQMIMRNSR
jgi:hypothetical protein